MMAIVKSKGSPYRDGAFPSGTNWEDYILWCLVEMGKECDRGEAEKIDSVDIGQLEDVLEEEEHEGGGGRPAALTSSNTTQSICFRSTNIPMAHFSSVESAFLHGHYGDTYQSTISAGMQSDLFGNARINASIRKKDDVASTNAQTID
jgi:hypothetical protein